MDGDVLDTNENLWEADWFGEVKRPEELQDRTVQAFPPYKAQNSKHHKLLLVGELHRTEVDSCHDQVYHDCQLEAVSILLKVKQGQHSVDVYHEFIDNGVLAPHSQV